MGLFGNSRNTVEDHLRKQLENVFEQLAKDAIKDSGNDPIMGGIMLTSSFGAMRNSLLQDSDLISTCRQNGINLSSVLDEEIMKAKRKYMKQY